jgi:hypothetical protein
LSRNLYIAAQLTLSKMAIVGYLLGAGASAECIPVVAGMANDLEKLRNELFSFFSEQQDHGGFDVPPGKIPELEILHMLESLAKICKTHYSIDTYAKKLYLTDPAAFRMLKLDLSIYFTLRQVLADPDKRYDNFFSSIINSDNKLPANIKIISWNYDFQLERSFCEFNPGINLDLSRDKLGITAPNRWSEISTIKNKFRTLKLNGSARLSSKSVEGYLFSTLHMPKEDIVSEIINKYTDTIRSKDSFECEIKFAWEGEHYDQLFESARLDLENIDVLVVIGYSFPFFNREVDISLFRNMPNLKKIYIQDKYPEDIKETMSEIIDTEFYSRVPSIILKSNLNQFVFPKELDVTSYFGE